MQEGLTPDPISHTLAAQEEQRQPDPALYRDAETIEQSLRSIQHAMRYAIETDKSQLPLTPPQIQVLTLLIETEQKTGPTLTEISKAMGLAHSTVSGIVDRLERMGLVQRVTNPEDRRSSLLQVTEHVTHYLQHNLPSRRLQPLLLALQHATDSERYTVIEGLKTLQRLLTLSDTR